MLGGVDRVADLKKQWAETEHTPKLCQFVQRKLEEICVGRSLRHAVRKHCADLMIAPELNQNHLRNARSRERPRSFRASGRFCAWR